MTPPPMARRAYLHADANATLGAAAVAIVPRGEVLKSLTLHPVCFLRVCLYNIYRGV